MPRIRVLIVSLPAMLSDIVRALIADEPRVEVLQSESYGREGLHAAVARLQPDVVMMGAEAHESPEQLLLAFPRVRLLTVSADARAASLQTLFSRRVVLHDISAEELMDAILGSDR